MSRGCCSQSPRGGESGGSSFFSAPSEPMLFSLKRPLFPQLSDGSKQHSGEHRSELSSCVLLLGEGRRLRGTPLCPCCSLPNLWLTQSTTFPSQPKFALRTRWPFCARSWGVGARPRAWCPWICSEPWCAPQVSAAGRSEAGQGFGLPGWGQTRLQVMHKRPKRAAKRVFPSRAAARLQGQGCDGAAVNGDAPVTVLDAQ